VPPGPSAAPSAAPVGAEACPGGDQSAVRRLVAVLAAPDLRPGGAVFAVRAGKNTLGANRANDVCLAPDRQVSGEHAILLHRGGSFVLADRMSSNGTWVNGHEVPANGSIEVHDRDHIRCGGVELLLLVLDTTPAPHNGAEPPRQGPDST
jgi:predicted component of type VI protein secretion system